MSKKAKYNKSPHIENSSIENFNVNYGQQNLSQKVTYEGDKQNIILYELFSPILIKKFGEKSLGIAGTISLIVGIIQLLIWANSFGPKLFSYLPSFQGSIVNWILGGAIVFTILGIFFIGVIVYFRTSKCVKCGKVFAYAEYTKPDVEEIRTHNGIRIKTTRKYECKYCGDLQEHSSTVQETRNSKE